MFSPSLAAFPLVLSAFASLCAAVPMHDLHTYHRRLVSLSYFASTCLSLTVRQLNITAIADLHVGDLVSTA